MRKLQQVTLPVFLVCLAIGAASAQSFRVQCPTSTITHPLTGTNCSTNPTGPGCNNTEPAYNGPTQFTTNAQGYVTPASGTVNGAIKCQQISGGDGYMTEADGTQTFMFSFGPLSGLADVAAGLPSTEFPGVDSQGVVGNGFNSVWPGCTDSTNCPTPLQRGDPATTDGATSGASPWTGAPGPYTPGFTWNGAVGLAPEVLDTVNVSDVYEGPIPPPGTAGPCGAGITANTVTAYTYQPINLPVGSTVIISGVGTTGTAAYDGTYTITCITNEVVVASSGFTQYAFQYVSGNAGLASQTLLAGPTASSPPQLDGHVDPRPIMDVGPMNGNIPAPLAAFDEDDEFFLTLTNVGMIMRPDLFE